MLDKRLDAISAEDIEQLLRNEVPEDLRLDYKEQLIGHADGDKKEFLADVTSFANTRGGFIVYGIRERRDADGKPTGKPESVVGLAVNEDAEKLRMESILADGVSPRIHGIELGFVHTSRGAVLLVRIPESFAAPHAVWFHRTSKFYARNSAGKYQLDVGEIRVAFSASERLPERIREFRLDRAAKIKSRTTPVPIVSEGGVLLLHVVPASAFGLGHLDVTARIGRHRDLLRPTMTSSPVFRHNFDGYLAMGRVDEHGDVPAYTQMFRNGAIEILNTSLLSEVDEDARPLIASVAVEAELIDRLKRCFQLYDSLGIDPPILVMLSLLDVRGFRMPNPVTAPDAANPHRIDRDDLYFPELLADRFDEPADVVLRPSFDQLWQAAGWWSCPHYSASGRWHAPQSRGGR